MHKIAILNCDTPVPAVRAVYPEYSSMFIELFQIAAKKDVFGGQYPDLVPASASSSASLDDGGNSKEVVDLELEFSSFDAVVGKLPSLKQLDALDGIVVTGSAASAYDTDPWVINLTEYIREIYTSHPHIKLFGSCFGHQVIAHALFSPSPKSPYSPSSSSTSLPTTVTAAGTPSPHGPIANSVVQHDPKGYELGIHAITLTPDFLSFAGPVLSNPKQPDQCRLQFIHADHVVLPSSSPSPPSSSQQQYQLPDAFQPIGSTPHCHLQGLFKPGRVLTYQGHIEFSEFVNVETVRIFGRAWGEDWEAKVLEAEGCMKGAVDAVWAAAVVVKFFVVAGEGGEKRKEGMTSGMNVSERVTEIAGSKNDNATGEETAAAAQAHAVLVR